MCVVVIVLGRTDCQIRLLPKIFIPEYEKSIHQSIHQSINPSIHHYHVNQNVVWTCCNGCRHFLHFHEVSSFREQICASQQACTDTLHQTQTHTVSETGTHIQQNKTQVLFSVSPPTLPMKQKGPNLCGESDQVSAQWRSWNPTTGPACSLCNQAKTQPCNFTAVSKGQKKEEEKKSMSGIYLSRSSYSVGALKPHVTSAPIPLASLQP